MVFEFGVCRDGKNGMRSSSIILCDFVESVLKSSYMFLLEFMYCDYNDEVY